eukprot:scaffold128745_cov36-Tisochrysis_lutea.AAC.2
MSPPLESACPRMIPLRPEQTRTGKLCGESTPVLSLRVHTASLTMRESCAEAPWHHTCLYSGGHS